MSVTQSLTDYYFPVKETEILYKDTHDESAVLRKLAAGFKGIIREDNGRLISIQPKTYKLLHNKDVIEGLMNELTKFDNKWKIGQDSYVTDQRMRLYVTFPDLIVKDSESEIALSYYLDNSYDSTTGLRGLFGGIRAVCSNGCIWGNFFVQIYGRHTRHADPQMFTSLLPQVIDKIPELQKRISLLEQEVYTESDLNKEKMKEVFGAGITNHVYGGTDYLPVMSKWQLYNMITWYISHQIDVKNRQNYYAKLSKQFKL